MVYYIETHSTNVYYYGKHTFITSKGDGNNIHTIGNAPKNPKNFGSFKYIEIKDRELIKVIFSKDKW